MLLPPSVTALQKHNSPCFLTMLSVSSKNKLTHIARTASKIIGLPTSNLSDLTNRGVTHNALTTAPDPGHNLKPFFILLQSDVSPIPDTGTKKTLLKLKFFPICHTSAKFHLANHKNTPWFFVQIHLCCMLCVNVSLLWRHT